MWQVTCDRRHMTYDTWSGVNILLKFQLSSSNDLGVMMFWRCGGKGWSWEESVAAALWEQSTADHAVQKHQETISKGRDEFPGTKVAQWEVLRPEGSPVHSKTSRNKELVIRTISPRHLKRQLIGTPRVQKVYRFLRSWFSWPKYFRKSA